VYWIHNIYTNFLVFQKKFRSPMIIYDEEVWMASLAVRISDLRFENLRFDTPKAV
jgi:hypothetical protein